MAGMDSLLGAGFQLVGQGLGGAAGIAGAFGNSTAAGDLRKRVREGVGIGQAEAVRQAGTVLSDPGYVGAQNWIRGMFGIGGSAAQDNYQALLGQYGPEGSFGFGIKGYGSSNKPIIENGRLQGGSDAAWNQAYLKNQFAQAGVNTGGGGGAAGDWTSSFEGMTGPAAALQGRMDELNQALSGMQSAQALGERAAGDVIVNSAKLLGVGSHQAKWYRKTGIDTIVTQLQDKLKGYEGQMQQYQPQPATPAAPPMQQGLSPIQEAGPSANAQGGMALDALGQQFGAQIRQAQSVRGMFNGDAAAMAEGSGLAAFRANLQMQLLPQLMQQAQGASTLTNQFLSNNLNASVFQQTGGKMAFNQANSGATSGGQPGAESLQSLAAMLMGMGTTIGGGGLGGGLGGGGGLQGSGMGGMSSLGGFGSGMDMSSIRSMLGGII
jgi:hypothetical protein